MITKENLLNIVNSNTCFSTTGVGQENPRTHAQEFSCAGLIFSEAKKIGAMDRYIQSICLYNFINNPIIDISQDNLKPGDILFTNQCAHCGVYIGDGEVVQSLIFKGVKKTKLSQTQWKYAARPTWKGWFDNR